MIVTISRAYGANGKAVGAALAAELSYRLVDEELPRLAALRLGTTPRRSCADWKIARRGSASESYAR